MKKQQKYSILIWMFAPVLSWYLIDRIIYYVFYGYPNFIVERFQNFSDAKTKQDVSLNVGTFGDMYGALNSFLSAIASIGAVVAIFVQIWLFYKDKREKVNDEHRKLIYLRHNLINLEFELLNICKDFQEAIFEEYIEKGIDTKYTSINNFEPNLQSIRLLKGMDVEIYFILLRSIDVTASANYLELSDNLEKLENYVINLSSNYEEYRNKMRELRFEFKSEFINFSLKANLSSQLEKSIINEISANELELKLGKLQEDNSFNTDDENLNVMFDGLWQKVLKIERHYNGFPKRLSLKLLNDSLLCTQSITDKIVI